MKDLKRKIFTPSGIRTPSRRVSSPVSIPTTLSPLYFEYNVSVHFHSTSYLNITANNIMISISNTKHANRLNCQSSYRASRSTVSKSNLQLWRSEVQIPSNIQNSHSTALRSIFYEAYNDKVTKGNVTFRTTNCMTVMVKRV